MAMTKHKTPAQKKAQKKYVNKGRFINIFFSESELYLYDKIAYLSAYYKEPKTRLIKSILKEATDGKIENGNS